MQTQKRLPSWGRAYVVSVVVLGGATILFSVYQLHARPIGWNWFILALLTLIAGSATVKLPSVPATISISETFVFTSVLLFGPAAGTLTVTLDVLAISWWLARRGHPTYRIAFNVFALPASLWIGAQAYYRLVGLQPLALSSEPVQISALLIPLIVFTLVYFLLNSWLIALAIFFETNQAPFSIWRKNFAWLSLNYFGGASVAALLVTYTRNLDYTFVAFVLPLLAVLYFTFSMAMGRVEDANQHLKQLNKLYMSTIETLAMAIDAKDQITHGHIRRVQTYAVGLAKTIGVTDNALINAIEAASLLHDMGKLAVPEYILNKPGPLTSAEFEKMKMHASVGADILSAIEFPYPVVPIVRHHHENWDGTGYPDGLSGADIPVGARILSVVDCFDALTSDRPYRPRLTDKEALRILSERRGTMYDPLVVDTFSKVYRQIAPSEPVSDQANSLKAITESGAQGLDSFVPTQRLEEISASTDEMLTLFELARSVSPNMNVSDIADIISKHVKRLIPCSLCVFYVLEADTDELLAAHVAGEQAGVVSGLRIQRGQRLSGWVAANRQTIRNSDPVLDFGESARAMSPRPRSCLSTPLIAKNELIGVLTLYSSNREAFSIDHERIVEIIARQVAPVLKVAGEAAAEKAQSHRDELTGLPNIEQFIQFSRSAQHSGVGPATPSAVLIIDIDNLNQINIELGRRMGDTVLNFIVDIAKRSLRSSDVLFRHEDDQFVAVLLHTAANAAQSIAGHLKTAVATSHGALPVEVTVSVALACAPTDGTTFERLLEVARDRLSSRPHGSRTSDNNDRIH